MASQQLRKRANWQTISGAKALKTEGLFQVGYKAPWTHHILINSSLIDIQRNSAKI